MEMNGHRSAGRLLVGLTALLLLGGCGAGATPSPSTQPSPSPSPSPAALTDEALVAELIAVFSEPYDAAKVAALYAPDAVIQETTAKMTQRGLDEIGARIREFNDAGFEAVVTSAPIRQDDFVAAFAKYGTKGDLSDGALVVYELKDGKVVNNWVYDAGAAPATSSPAASVDDALVADLLAMTSDPYDAAKVAALYAPNAVFYDKVANETHKGLEAIQAKGEAMAADEDFKIVVTSAPIRQGDFVAHFVKFGNTAELTGRGLMVYELKDGKIVDQWAYPAP
jgi:hypothetical protein